MTTRDDDDELDLDHMICLSYNPEEDSEDEKWIYVDEKGDFIGSNADIRERKHKNCKERILKEAIKGRIVERVEFEESELRKLI